MTCYVFTSLLGNKRKFIIYCYQLPTLRCGLHVTMGMCAEIRMLAVGMDSASVSWVTMIGGDSVVSVIIVRYASDR